MTKECVIQSVASLLLESKTDEASSLICDEYPFDYSEAGTRKYTVNQKYEQFCKDGFIDRYSGERLVNPGLLKVISVYLPKAFPYHPHWKMSETHIAYWELTPTIDHIVPVALGGADDTNNWITTSMVHNSIKSNWTLEQIGWEIHSIEQSSDWDGLTSEFVKLVEKDISLCEDSYIRKWYNAANRLR